ncbi:lipopolysaccharide biosynthesis protein [Rhodococcus sp. NPDC060086]|uniref:lipopolysaccharide biosynthesis protein n=1 Tax=Rhodococcus sp. NPDC060086 TaxID=3347055 RepID=UPI003664C952
MRRALSALTHETVLSQAISGVFAIVQLGILTRLLDVSDYAIYVVAAAIWAIANAAVGVGIGIRISNDAANGSTSIAFTVSERYRTLLAVLICGVSFAILSGTPVECILVGVTLLSYVACESAIAFVVGSRQFRKFLYVFTVRSGAPVIVMVLWAFLGDLSFTGAVIALMIGQFSAAMMLWRHFSVQKPSVASLSSGLTGSISLGMWVLASADKIILEQLVNPEELASYAMAYGLLDRVFRAIQNIYTSRNMADAFSGKLGKSSHWLSLGILALALVMSPVAVVACGIISGGRYQPDLLLALVISLGLAIMTLSAPPYLKMMSTKKYAGPIIVIYGIASGNILGNILLAPKFGVLGAGLLTLAAYLTWLGYLYSYSVRFATKVSVP